MSEAWLAPDRSVSVTLRQQDYSQRHISADN
jgi:hypothetical protein